MMLLIFYCFLFLVSKVNVATGDDESSLIEDEIEDEAMAAVAKGSFSEFCTKYGLNFDSINHLLVQKYEVYLGVLYLLRENWECEKVINKIKKEMKEREQNNHLLRTYTYEEMSKVWESCEKYRKHVYILYEYLFMEYAGEYVKDNYPNLAQQIPAVKKPMFELIQKDKSSNDMGTVAHIIRKPDTVKSGTLFDAIKTLSFIWESYRSIIIFYYYDTWQKTNLLNEAQYEINFNQAFRLKHLFKPDELNLDGESKFDNLYEPVHAKFDETMKKYLKQAKKINGNKNIHDIILYIKYEEFYELDTAIDDNAFLTIITNEINFEKFCNKILTIKSLKLNSLKQLNLEESKKVLTQKYAFFHGIMYLMNEKWQCDKIVIAQGKCEHFRKYLKILFDYLLRVYEDAECSPMARQFLTVRPIFKFGYGKKIESLTNVVDRLSQIATYFFDLKYAKEYQSKVEEAFKNAPNLINANDLKYDKSPGKKIIELIIGKSPKREKGKGESSTDFKENSYGLIQQFNNQMNEMSINAKKIISEKGTDEEKVKWSWLFSSIKLDDQLLLSFIKDQEKLDEYCKKLEGEQLLKNIGLLSKRKGKGIYDIGETVEYLTKQYEGYLGVLYLFKEKWKCDGITENKKREKCEKFQKYVEILYEYLLKIFVEAKNWPMAQYFPTSIPNFHLGREAQTAILIDVFDSLIHIWAFFFDSTYHIQFDYKLEKMFEKFPNYELKLLNEQAFEQFEKNGQKIRKNLKDIKIFGSLNQMKNLNKGKKNEIPEGLLKESEEKNCINADEKAISALREEFGVMMKEKAEKVAKIIYSEEEGIGKMKKELKWLVK